MTNPSLFSLEFPNPNFCLFQIQIKPKKVSVTEREVIHGILKAPIPNEHCLCYVRHIQNININQTNTASKFTDIVHKQVNIEAQKLLANLRDERVPSKLCAKNIRRSTVEWAGREGMDVHAHAEYLKEFCRDFYSSITTQVDNAMRKYDKFRDELFAEILQHLSNGKAGAEMFFGRSQELMHAKEYSISENNLPLIFYGENGCGKTSIMAKIATECRGWLTDAVEPVLILRFLGTSPDSSSISPLLNSLCEQIAHNYNPILKTQCPTEVSKLFLHYKKMMSLASKEKPLIMILDSLDQLSKIDSAEELLWFPPQLPSNVKVIVSFSSNTTIEGNMNKLVENRNQYILVPSLGDELGLEVIQRWLKSIALSYITAARSGLSDSELEDLISLDDKVLDDIYRHLIILILNF
uniref:NACHT domain-containing protein n=1 Tax=Panagrolaimus sp. PS1159 TaxID=55785 RepID=A0AC35EXK7_9BILA